MRIVKKEDYRANCVYCSRFLFHNPEVEELVVGIGECIVDDETLKRHREKVRDEHGPSFGSNHMGKGR